jgi:hypothetical protein
MDIDIRYKHILQVSLIAASVNHCEFGKLEQKVGYLLFLPTNSQ